MSSTDSTTSMESTSVKKRRLSSKVGVNNSTYPRWATSDSIGLSLLPSGRASLAAQQVSQGRDDTTQDPKEQDNDEDSIDEHPELAELDQHLVDGRERDRPEYRPEKGADTAKGQHHEDNHIHLGEPKVVGLIAPSLKA